MFDVSYYASYQDAYTTLAGPMDREAAWAFAQDYVAREDWVGRYGRDRVRFNQREGRIIMSGRFFFMEVVIQEV